MTITICGSITAMERMEEIKKQLEISGCRVLMPIAVDGVDYWDEKGGAIRTAAKKSLNLISGHLKKVEESQAILVVNIDKRDIKNYIGANTFLEIGVAFYLHRPIYLLNPLPDQPYLIEEVEAMDPIILNGNLDGISIS